MRDAIVAKKCLYRSRGPALVSFLFLECLKALGYIERAAESYARVVDLAPLHLDARISLSTLQQQLGRPEKALEALEPMYDPDTLAQDANAAQQVSTLTLCRANGGLKSEWRLERIVWGIGCYWRWE